MKILDFLRLDGINAFLDSDSKDAVLGELVDPIAKMNPQLDRIGLLKNLKERENLGSTGIGGGVAIPHGKIEGLDRLSASFGRSVKGVDFNSMDHKPAFIFFLIVAPKNSAGDHLKALARISRMFKDPLLKNSLIRADSSQEIFSIIEDYDLKIP
jgi:nitrogen PTS system EIIA component